MKDGNVPRDIRKHIKTKHSLYIFITLETNTISHHSSLSADGNRTATVQPGTSGADSLAAGTTREAARGIRRGIGADGLQVPCNRIRNLRKALIQIFFFVLYSALALAEASKETYPDEEGSLSGSMLSLAHSNSSTSFPAGSL